MTMTNDLDRLLAEWLDDGPRQAPDRPLEIALDHARSHPRRRDPLGFLRPDAMAPRSSGLGLRPVMVLAVLGLLLAAVVAVGVGSPKEAVQPPGPSASPSGAPSPSGSPGVSPTGPAHAGILVELVVPAGEPQTVDVVDESGLLVSATSGGPTGETGASFPFDAVEVTNIDERTLQLGWTGYPCRTDHRLSIAASLDSMVLTRPGCTGDTDTIAVDRILILAFSDAVSAVDIEVDLQP